MARLLVNIDVPDLDAAVRFYCDAFALRVGRRLAAEVIELLGAEAPIYLLAKPRGSLPHAGAKSARDYARHWTPVHLDFVVDDIDEAVTRAGAAGATLEAAIADHAWGRIAHGADPYGHGFCLLQFTAAGYDAI